MSVGLKNSLLIRCGSWLLGFSLQAGFVVAVDERGECFVVLCFFFIFIIFLFFFIFLFFLVYIAKVIFMTI